MSKDHPNSTQPGPGYCERVDLHCHVDLCTQESVKYKRKFNQRDENLYYEKNIFDI